MKYDQAAVDLALAEIDKVPARHLRKVLRLVRTLQAARLLKVHALWPAELEAVARYTEDKIRRHGHRWLFF